MTNPDPTPPGDPATPPVPPTDPTPPTPPDDKPLGPAGERALAAEREARKALEREVAKLAPLANLLGGAAPTGDGRTDLELLTERVAGYERDLADERSARTRLEVAAEKGLSPKQASRLRGATKAELLADADELLTEFPAAPAGPRTPAPDPSQGARGGTPLDLDAQIAEAQSKGDWKAQMRLNTLKLANLAAKTN